MSEANPAAEAAAMDRKARKHKRLSEFHRQQARACRERQKKLEAKCRRLGIKVIYRQQGGGMIHGRTSPGTGNRTKAS